eukprot:TRINITY_DN2041_c0_g1_i1.p1 TRINITY_DN2041_c0_g1~~TRINITY_DN2041_c0_g1_i1.p1  ORF type:complete len:162 (-),score=31.52 TRINITY_DN2041_c0_g1_i1:60-545(-)
MSDIETQMMKRAATRLFSPNKLVAGKQKYLSMCCCALLLLGFLSFITAGLAPLQLLSGLMMIVLAVFGFLGNCFPGGKYLLYFLIGTGFLVVYNIFLILYLLLKDSSSESATEKVSRVASIVIDAIAIVFYGFCLLFGMLVRAEKMKAAAASSGSWFSASV